MSIAKGNKKLVIDGYAAWLSQRDPQNSPDSVRLFGEQMTDNDARDYEGMSQAEVRRLIESC